MRTLDDIANGVRSTQHALCPGRPVVDQIKDRCQYEYQRWRRRRVHFLKERRVARWRILGVVDNHVERLDAMAEPRIGVLMRDRRRDAEALLFQRRFQSPTVNGRAADQENLFHDNRTKCKERRKHVERNVSAFFAYLKLKK